MCSPMFELPEHLLIPVDADGNGPAEPENTAREACWCGDNTCPGPTRPPGPISADTTA